LSLVVEAMTRNRQIFSESKSILSGEQAQ